MPFLIPQILTVRSAGARTEQYILFVNDDGSIGVFTAHRQEKLAGWVYDNRWCI